MGRPPTGALGAFDLDVSNKIKRLRKENEGWGALTILVEMEQEFSYSPDSLPSASSVNRYLKESGFIKPFEPSGILPSKPCEVPKAVHQCWEMDAQGATEVKGTGHQATINMKDGLSKKHCMAFPVAVKNQSSQPATNHYKWAFRLAFIESGLPGSVQVDKDSVFIENTSRSPFPSRLQLWLAALGVELCFIDKPPPAKQAMVERSHQTMERQAMRGKAFANWQQFFRHCNKRRHLLNEKFPSRSLGKKAPLEAYPEAAHSARYYSVEKEHAQIDVQRVYDLLSKGKWYRAVSSGKMVSLGGHRYYLKEAVPKSQLQVTFGKESNLLIFRNDKELEVASLPLIGVSPDELVGVGTKILVSIYKKLLTSKDFPL
jgi:hypothetical protein